MNEARLKKSEWEVRAVSLDVAAEMVGMFHYAKGGSNTRTYLHGLFRRGSFWDTECNGVAWWIPPTKSAALATYPEHWEGVLCLHRLVIKPSVPKNACTFLMAHSVKLIDRKRWPCLVTYADTGRGHTGNIYRGAGWVYAGLTAPEETYTLNGVMVSRKAGPTTRTRAQMLELGAQPQGKHAKHKFVLKAS